MLINGVPRACHRSRVRAARPARRSLAAPQHRRRRRGRRRGASTGDEARASAGGLLAAGKVSEAEAAALLREGWRRPRADAEGRRRPSACAHGGAFGTVEARAVDPQLLGGTQPSWPPRFRAGRLEARSTDSRGGGRSPRSRRRTPRRARVAARAGRGDRDDEGTSTPSAGRLRLSRGPRCRRRRRPAVGTLLESCGGGPTRHPAPRSMGRRCARPHV